MREEVKVNISYQLEGEEAREFLTYKDLEFIDSNAEYARKLMRERMREVKQERNPSPQNAKRPATKAA